MVTDCQTKIYWFRLTNMYKWKFKTKRRLYPPPKKDSDTDLYVLSATVQNEINKAGKLDMEIVYKRPSGKIKPYWDFICVFDEYTKSDGSVDKRDVLFFGRVISTSTSMNLSTKVTCEGYLACLMDAPMTAAIVEKNSEPFKIVKESYLKSHFEVAVKNYILLCGREDVTYNCENFSNKLMMVDEDTDISIGTTVGSYIIDDLVNTYGGVCKIDRTSEKCIPFGDQKLTVTWIDDPSTSPTSYSENTVGIEFGVNMLDVSYEPMMTEIFTAVMPFYSSLDKDKKYYWDLIDYKKNPSTNRISGYEDTSLPGYALQYIEKTSMVNKYGLIIKAQSFDNVKSKDKLYKKAKQWLSRNCKDYGDTYTFRAIDAHFIAPYYSDGSPNVHYIKSESSRVKRMHILDRISIISFPKRIKKAIGVTAIDKIKDTVCTSITYDILHPENDSVTISVVIPPDLTDTKLISRAAKAKRDSKKKSK